MRERRRKAGVAVINQIGELQRRSEDSFRCKVYFSTLFFVSFYGYAWMDEERDRKLEERFIGIVWILTSRNP